MKPIFSNIYMLNGDAKLAWFGTRFVDICRVLALLHIELISLKYNSHGIVKTSPKFHSRKSSTFDICDLFPFTAASH